MRLHLIRHPPPEIEAGICYGRSDIPARTGEAEKLIDTLLPSLPARSPVFSSPLQRCSELAVRLADALHAPAPVHDMRLAEMHFGEWELRGWDAISRADIDAWAADLVSYRPGGGENIIEVAARLHAFLEDAKGMRADDIIVVTHAGVIRLLLEIGNGADVKAAALAAARTRRDIGYGELVVLDCQFANDR
jgi:alpha-ribazole phosphatase